MPTTPHATHPRRILLLGEDWAQLSAIEAALSGMENTAVSVETGQLAGINGHAVTFAKENDVVVFATDGSDDDIAVLQSLTAGADKKAVFIAIAGDDVSLARARRLIDAGAVEVVPSGMETGLMSVLRAEATPPAELAPVETRDAGTVISVVQTRGGAGSTTVACNLAVALAKARRRGMARGTAPRVVVLDLDIQFGNAGVFLDVEDNGALVDLMSQATTPGARAILAAAQPTAHGVDVVTTPLMFVPPSAMTPDRAAAIVAAFAAAYDYVVVDLPRAAVDWIEPVIARTDRLVLVSDLSVPCIRQAKRLTDLFHETQVALPTALVMNRERKPLFRSEAQREAERLLGLPVAAWLPDNRAEERRSVDLGVPSAARRTSAKRHYAALAKALMDRPTATATTAR